MIIIIGEIILITIPIVIYVLYQANNVRLKKVWLIIPEIIAVMTFLFCTFKIAGDVPNIAKGGALCNESISYVTETHTRFEISTVITQEGRRYWAVGGNEIFDSMRTDVREISDNDSIKLFVLPNTKLIYRIEYFTENVQFNIYSIYSINFELVVLGLIELVLLALVFKYKNKRKR